MSTKSSRIEAIIGNHLQAFFRKSVDDVVQDYTEGSVLIVPDGPLHGLSEIREFFTAFISTLPAGFLEAFEMHRQEFDGEVGYIVWKASPWVRLGTDTFFVRSGKIMLQTFAAYPPLS
jgi:ketosteroid isomerase-like protein